MARVTAAEAAEKWGRRLKGATQDIERGVRRVSEAPGMAAAKQADLMKTNINKAIDSGRWAKNVASVTLEDWQDKIINKGIGRITAGVDQAAAKQEVMYEKLLRNVDESVAIVNRTPRGDINQNIQRMVTFATEMNKRKLK